LTTRSDADSEKNPDPRHVKQANFVSGHLVQVDGANDGNMLEEAIEDVLDIKNEFTASQSAVILCTTPVLEDTDCVKLGRLITVDGKLRPSKRWIRLLLRPELTLGWIKLRL
jgi:hypothetical protein